MEPYGRMQRCSLAPEDAVLRLNSAQGLDTRLKARRPSSTSFEDIFANSTSAAYSRLEASASSSGSTHSQRSSVSSIPSTASSNSVWAATGKTPPWQRRPPAVEPPRASSREPRRPSLDSIGLRMRSSSRRPKVQSRPLFEKLPSEVFDCILFQLKAIHKDPVLNSCPSCLARDYYNFCLVSRSWDRHARRHLYTHINPSSPSPPSHSKRYKLKCPYPALVLLRRTLRSRPHLAAHVLSLHVPIFDSASFPPRETCDLLASLIMSCPNLRTFNPTPLYNHTFTRLFHALSTRPHIREHSWLIAPNSEATTRSHTQLSNLLSPQQTVLFLHSHARWKELSHLAIHALPGAILESRLLERLFNRLPNLTHLSLANLDEDDFTSTTLLRVPPLLSLRLTNLPGITSTGIAQWASTPQAQCLRWLGLFDVPVREMGVLAKLLARLKALKELMLVQKEEPVHEEEVVFHPLLVSPSLEKITWDCRPGIPAARPETRTEDIDQAPRRGRRGSIQFSRDSFDTSGLSNRAESRDRAGLVSGTGTSTPTPFYTPLSTVPSGSHSSTPTLPSLRHSLPTIPTQTSYFPAFAPALLSPTGTPRDSSPASFVPSTSSPKTPKAPLDSSDLPTPDSTATTLLALSITHAGLPALKQLRTASDPSGALQSVCVPRFSFLARGDRFHPATRLDPAEYNQTLHAARKGAEGRARAARDGSVQAGKKRGCEIRVGDDGGEDGSGGDGNRVGNGEEEGEGRVLARGGWVGVWPGLGGGVEYVLEERGRVGVEIGIDGRGKREGKGRCNGNWNAAHGKGRKWWGHVERERDWGSVGGMEGLWS